MSRLQVAVGIIKNNRGQVLISRRKQGVHQEGLWEFPGGKVENEESIEAALARELAEELNIKLIRSTPLINVLYDYPKLNVQLSVRLVVSYTGFAIGAESQQVKWVDIKQLDDYQFPEANTAILKAIKLPREYAIINSSDINTVLQEIDSIVQQGVGLVQIRAKELAVEQWLGFSRELDSKCMAVGIEYLLNSNIVSSLSERGGLHLTSAQLQAASIKPEVNGYVAASCHNIEQLKKAEQLDLDFVVLSPIKETSSHPKAKLLGWSDFARLVAQVNIPVYALGGINKTDFNQAVNVGSQGISGISLFK